MKRFITLFTLLVACMPTAFSQITVTAADVPAQNDTLRYSDADPATNIDINNTGANANWDYSFLEPISQSIDTYKSATSVSFLLALSYASAYGNRTDISGLTGGIALPVPVSDVYYFYQKRTGPSRFVGRGYGASISGTTLPIAYGDEDELYYFPLAFNNYDSSTYALSTTIPNLGAIQINGTRKTTVDGWGKIKTPFFTTPVDCIRLRSVSDEIDSITYNGTTFGIPRTTIEYKWLTNNNHYPAVYVTANSFLGNETVTSIKYKDSYRTITSISTVQPNITQLNAVPNPANGLVTISIPANWHQYTTELYDLTGKKITQSINNNQLDLSNLPSGVYFAKVTCGTQLGLVKLMK